MVLSILIIAYEFYPINSGGSHRPFRMAKFLKALGYEPIVIAADYSPEQADYDSSLQAVLEQEAIRVIRVKAGKRDIFSRLADTHYFNVTDDTWRRWKRSVLSEIDNLIPKNNIILSIVTLPPFSLADAIASIRSRQIPVLADMRDAWSQWNVSPYASIVHYWLTLRKERKALRQTQATLVTSKVTMSDLEDLHGERLAEKLVHIPNSFDRPAAASIPRHGKKIEIGYIGSFYYDPYRDRLSNLPWWRKRFWQWFQYLPHKEHWIYRSPYFIFATVSGLLKRRPEYADRIGLHFAGHKPAWFDAMVDQFSLKSILVHHGFISKFEAGELQDKMDYMLITSSKRSGKKDYSIAGKTFDLLEAAKPILAFVADGAQKEILERTGTAVIFNPDDLDASVHKLQQVIDGDVVLRPDLKYINRYHTANALQPLLRIIERIA